MLSKKIRAYKEANPKAKAKEIATEVGCKPAYVYQVLLGDAKKNKPKLKPTEGQQVLRKEIDRLHALIANLEMLKDINDQIIEEQEAELEQLENDVIGYRAVISYLQGQLDGATV